MDAGLQQIVETLPDGIVLLDQSWRLTFANPTARRLSRIRPEHLLGPTHWELYPETLGTPIETTYYEVMERRVERRIDAFFYEPFQVWLDVRVLPIEGGIALYYRDVTATMSAESGRRAAVDQLQQVLAATTDGILSLDREYRIIYINPRAEKMLTPSGVLVGNILWNAFPETLDPQLPYRKAYQTAMVERSPTSFEAFYPAPLSAWFDVTVRPSGEGIIIFFRDVTEQKKRDAALIQSEKLAAVGRLASSIAHEINNPLESITNIIYIARQHAVLPEVQHYLALADQELRRVSVIANQTLRFHKQESSPKAVSCGELFASVLSLYEGRLRNSGITVEKRKRVERPVACFEGDIRQVLSNLVSNAIDAMPHGGRLLLRSREATDWRNGEASGRRGLRLTVADTGAGIPADVRSRIMEPFFTTKGTHGTGLGLWISAGILDRHQGSMKLRSSQSTKQHGTVFSLFLPFDLPPEAEPPS